MIYTKNNEVYNGGVLVIADRQVVNPTHEQLIAAGWTQEEAPVPTAEEQLVEAKITRLYELERYDASAAVNALTFGGVETWLDAQMRANYRNSIESAEILGETSVTVGLAGQAVVFEHVANRAAILEAGRIVGFDLQADPRLGDLAEQAQPQRAPHRRARRRDAGTALRGRRGSRGRRFRCIRKWQGILFWHRRHYGPAAGRTAAPRSTADSAPGSTAFPASRPVPASARAAASRRNASGYQRPSRRDSRTVVSISRPASGYWTRTTAASPFWLTRPVRRSAKVSSSARS